MFDLEKNLEHIKTIASQLTLDKISHVMNGSVEYDCLTGSCKGKALMNIGDIAIQDVKMEADTMLKPHQHNEEREILIVYDGDFTIDWGWKKLTIEGNGEIAIPKGQLHTAYSKNGCKLVGITIPSALGYPK